MCARMNWHSVLSELLSDGAFTTQKGLVDELAARGFSVNQATVSRALRRLGVRKVAGVYRAPAHIGTGPVHDYAVTAGGCLAVFQTNPAFASVVAQRIDRSGFEGILGTIAGDDTVFVAVTDGSVANQLASLFGLEPIGSL